MHDSLNILTQCTTLALTATERVGAARDGVVGNPVSSWWLALPILLVAMLLVMVAGLLYSRRQRMQREILNLFAKNSSRVGMSDEETVILLQIARLAGLKQVNAIFTMNAAFDMGVAALLRGNKLATATSEQRMATSAALDSLRDKLGFQHPSDVQGGETMSTQQITVSSHLTLCLAGTRDNVKALVSRNEFQQIVIDTVSPHHWGVGQRLQARYFDGAALWEFDTSVLSIAHGNVTIAHASNVRFINRRRFPRIPVQYQASVASFPFLPGQIDASPPRFMAAKVVEIAGTGIKFRAPLISSLGQWVLLVVMMDGKVIQGMGKIRRTGPVADGVTETVVEMAALGSAEVSELAHQTNIAAKRVTADASQDNPNNNAVASEAPAKV